MYYLHDYNNPDKEFSFETLKEALKFAESITSDKHPILRNTYSDSCVLWSHFQDEIFDDTQIEFSDFETTWILTKNEDD